METGPSLWGGKGLVGPQDPVASLPHAGGQPCVAVTLVPRWLLVHALSHALISLSSSWATTTNCRPYTSENLMDGNSLSSTGEMGHSGAVPTVGWSVWNPSGAYKSSVLVTVHVGTVWVGVGSGC